MQHNTDNCK